MLAREVADAPQHNYDYQGQGQLEIGSPVVFQDQLFVGGLLLLDFFVQPGHYLGFGSSLILLDLIAQLFLLELQLRYLLFILFLQPQVQLHSFRGFLGLLRLLWNYFQLRFFLPSWRPWRLGIFDQRFSIRHKGLLFKNIFGEISLLCQYDFPDQRSQLFLSVRVQIFDANIAEGIKAKNICKILKTLVSKFVMAASSGLGNRGTPIFDIALNNDGGKLGVEVLDDPVQSDVVAVVFLEDVLLELIQLPEVSVVELEEVSAHERQVQTCVEVFPLPLTSVFETFLKRELVESGTVGHHRSHIADGIFAPDFEAFHQLLTAHNDVIVDGEKDLRFSLRGYVIAPVHGIILCLVEIDGYLPVFALGEDAQVLHGLLVVPDYADFVDDGTLHEGVALEVFHELRVVACPRVRYCYQAETLSTGRYVLGTGASELPLSSTSVRRKSQRFSQQLASIILILLQVQKKGFSGRWHSILGEESKWRHKIAQPLQIYDCLLSAFAADQRRNQAQKTQTSRSVNTSTISRAIASKSRPRKDMPLLINWTYIITSKMSNPGQFLNYQYLMYNNSQSGYPSLSANPQEEPQTSPLTNQEELNSIVQYIKNLKDPEKREEALNLLSRKRQTYPDLPVLLWYSVGTITILLQQIIEIYSELSPPPSLKLTSSNRICLVVGLLQCLALHPQTRQEFLKAHIPLFLYPFLNTSTKSKIFENLRVTSLGVIGALVKQSDPYAIQFLMQTEIVPLCLRIMKNGQALSKTVATFIIQKILCDQKGLSYICATVQRFFAVSTVLNSMLKELIDNNKQDHRLSKHIMKCYSRLSENMQACQVLNKNLPAYLKDPPKNMLDQEGKKSYNTLMKNLNENGGMR